MLMTELVDVTWENLYECWKYNIWKAPSILEKPIVFDEVNIDYNKDGFIYGYDWLTQVQLQNRKNVIENDITQFLYFTETSNKGTIHTLQMLTEAETDEEIAAIWMYAIAFELIQNCCCGKAQKYAYKICSVTQGFLSQRFCFWHHAMRKLVPQIYTHHFIEDLESIESIIEIIVLNAALIRYEYVPVLYSSLKKGERYSEYSVRI